VQITNIINDYKWYVKVVDKIRSKAETTHHRNQPNYVDFEKRLEKYNYFHALINEDDIIAISGINDWSWPDGVARILDRTYYFDWEVRSKTMKVPALNKRWATNYMLPHQYNICKKDLFHTVFMSTENPKRKRSLRITMSEVNDRIGSNFIENKDLTRTCGNDKKECWQNVWIDHLSDNIIFKPEQITVKEYEKRYKTS
jgi:hypothetical protein